MEAANLGSILLSNLWFFPYLLVYLFGIAVAVLNWSRYPKASLLTFFAFVILLGTMTLGTALNIWLFNFGGRDQFQMDLGRIFGVVGFVRAVLNCIATAMLITAIYCGRQDKTSPFGSVVEHHMP